MRNSILRRILSAGEKKPLGILLLDIAIMVMFLVFLFMAGTAVFAFWEYQADRVYQPESLYYRLEDGDYERMAQMVWRNRVMGETDEEYAEYYAVADYFEAAVQYRICTETGDSAGAEKWLKKMADAEGRLGIFSGEKEKIRNFLWIR